MANKLYCCFLSARLYLIIFFALPVGLVLIINFWLFFIVLYRTKPNFEQQNETSSALEQDTNNHNSSNKMGRQFSNLFLRLGNYGFIMDWYILSVIIMESLNDSITVQIFTIIASCQINIQVK